MTSHLLRDPGDFEIPQGLGVFLFFGLLLVLVFSFLFLFLLPLAVLARAVLGGVGALGVLRQHVVEHHGTLWVGNIMLRLYVYIKGTLQENVK